MVKPTNTFVFVKKEINKNGVLIKENEIGIIEKVSKNNCEIFFVISGQSIVLSKKDFDVFDVQKTGDSYPKKVCNICHRLLPTKNFSRNQNAVNNRPVRRPSCDECRIEIDGVGVSLTDKRKWDAKKPEFVPFKCPICKKTTIPGLTSKVVLDHNHNNGKARGWICDSCNTGLGRFKDDIKLLQSAIKFLKTK